MKPLPWSYSALDTHENCPKQYHHKYVLKDLPPEEKSPQQEWGTFVHQEFENYLSTKPTGANAADPTKSGYTLPVDLRIHQPYLDGLLQKGGQLWTERKVALGRKPFGPCSYFDRTGSVWWRGVIDCTVLELDEGRATIVDYKTGKKFDKWDQLAMNAVWVFLAEPKVNLINAQFYWTEDQTTSKKVWARGELDALVGLFLPKLGRFVNSFQTDTFTPKQSGLCGGWCPVKNCMFWREKNEGRRR